MRIQRGAFNLFFGMAMAAAIGCVGSALAAEKPAGPAKAAEGKDKKPKDASPDKQASSLRLHVEAGSGGVGTGKIQVLRTNSVFLTVERSPFVDEGFIEEARVVEGIGGHMISVRYNSQGALRLQMWTASNPGRHVAVWAKWTEARWIAAPIPPKPLEDGVIIFTPDASREESERIVRGLNNVAIKLGNQQKPKKAAKTAKAKAKEDKSPDDDLFIK
jgi:hypothetical protein